MMTEPPHKKLRITLESYEEKRIKQIAEDGTESYIIQPSDEEYFSSIIRLLKYNPTKPEQLPTLHKPPPKFPLLKNINDLREGMQELDQLIELLDTIKKNEYLEVFELHRIPRQHLSNMQLYKLYQHKRDQINIASNILSNAVKNLNVRLECDRKFFNELYQRQSNWLLMHTGVDSFGRRTAIPNIDLAFSNASFGLYKYVPVTILRKKSNELEYCLPPLLTSDKTIQLCSNIKEMSLDKCLEEAQDSLFQLELFDRIVNSMMKHSPEDICHYEDYEIKFRVGNKEVVSFQLRPCTDKPFMEFVCTSCLEGMDSNLITTMMKQGLLLVYKEIKENPSNILLPPGKKKAVKDYSKVFKNVLIFLKHKIFVFEFLKQVEQIKHTCVQLLMTKYPNESIFRVDINNNKKISFLVNIIDTDIYVQTKRDYGIETNMLMSLSEIKEYISMK